MPVKKLFCAYKFISIQILSSPRFIAAASTIVNIHDVNIIGFFNTFWISKLIFSQHLLVPHCAWFFWARYILSTMMIIKTINWPSHLNYYELKQKTTPCSQIMWFSLIKESTHTQHDGLSILGEWNEHGICVSLFFLLKMQNVKCILFYCFLLFLFKQDTIRGNTIWKSGIFVYIFVLWPSHFCVCLVVDPVPYFTEQNS